MANETAITITGHLVADPELRYTPSGKAVANFRIATNPRRYDSQSNQWVDGEASFYTCNIWGKKAEAVAGQLAKGAAAIVVGSIAQRNWEDKQGNTRSTFEVKVDEVGAMILPPKNGGQGGYSGGQGNWSGGQQAGPSGTNSQGGYGQPAQDAWNQAPQGGFDGAQEPPF